MAEILESLQPTMITNTRAYTIVAIAYMIFAVSTWLMFSR